MNADEFRKPYEYTEEKRGLLLLFVFMIVTIDILQAPLYLVPVYNHINNQALSIGFILISALYYLLMLFTAIACYNAKKRMVTLSKAYLIIRVILMVSCIIVLFICNVKGKTMISFGNQYDTVAEYTVTGLIAPLAFELLFSAGWLLYFLKSKRCKEIANKLA